MEKIAKFGYLAGATRFRRISEKLHIDGDKIYKENGLNFKASWFSVFYLLSITEEPMSILALSQEIGVSHITIKNIVRELAEENLLRIETHPSDKRSKLVSITEKGKELAKILKNVWSDFNEILKNLFNVGHPDLLHSLNRIETELAQNPIHTQLQKLTDLPKISIVDYRPSLKKSFYELAGGWLLELLNGSLEEEDNFTLHHPEQAYLLSGGFIFYALYNDVPVGCVALKRLNENSFEFAKLFVTPKARNLGIATKLIERCVTRCHENGAKKLWLQTALKTPEAHRIYTKLGFTEEKEPLAMKVLRRTEKIMVYNFSDNN